jgi:pimeloyl-ACP methyl ester carboxylesterase
MSLHKALLPVPAIFTLLLSACAGATSTNAVESPGEPAAAELTSAVVDSPTETPQEVASPWISQFDPLPPEPQRVAIPVLGSNRELAGLYYPAKVNPAPIVVLMHWAGGDMTDWRAITPWLQNRADELSYKANFAKPVNQVDGPWLDPSWFPTILPEASFAVLVFDYNGFGQSAGTTDADGLLQDSVAAIRFATTLEGIDPNMIVTVGASIGADGAVDACYLFNELYGATMGQCIGAMSLSPGNYLTNDFPYAQAVTALSETGHFVFCLAAVEDGSSAATCETAEMAGDFYAPFYYSGEDHGMFLVDPTKLPFQPEMDPRANALELLLGLLAMSIQRNVTP